MQREHLDGYEEENSELREASDESVVAGQILHKGQWRRKGIYLLPNLITSGALFCGFFAIVKAMNGDFGVAVSAIAVAMLLDGMDGRVARMTSTQSAFGAEYDSLSDMVSFGVAPALVMYEWALKDLGKFGWVAAFVYVAGGALRLARFNTQLSNPDKRFFQGLPTPSAAALVSGFVWVMHERLGMSGADVPYCAAALSIAVGLTMVSNVPYYSFKTVNVKQSIPFIMLVVLALGFAVVMSEPAVIFFLFVMYWVAGYAYALVRFYQRRALPRLSHDKS